MLRNKKSSGLILHPGSGKKIWALGGGKGGVGKSFVASNLALTLAKQGKSVIAVDLDLGGANLHTCLGQEIPRLSISDFLSGRCSDISQILTPTPLANLKFISGANDSVAAASISLAQQKKLVDAIITLNADYILTDLGAGTHDFTLEYFNMADKPIVIVTPEPTSIENAYRFIKSSYYLFLKDLEKKLGLSSAVEKAMDHKNNLGIRTPFDLIKYIAEQNASKGIEFRRLVDQFKIHIIVNQVRTRSDAEIGHAIQSVCRKYFGIDAQYLGYLDYENAAWQSVRKKRPIILEFPHSSIVAEFFQIIKGLEESESDSRAKLLRTA